MLRTYKMSVPDNLGSIFRTKSTTRPMRKACSMLLGFGPPKIQMHDVNFINIQFNKTKYGKTAFKYIVKNSPE